MHATRARDEMTTEPVGAGPAAQTTTPLVSAVIPCLNEERTIGFCIDKAFRSFREMGIVGEVVVADNGSSDRSVEISAAHGARVIHASVKGYGAALRAGIDAAEGSIIVMADGDESYDWAAIAPFVRKVQEGYDLVMGNRFLGPAIPGAMPPLHRYVGNPVLSTIARIAFRTRIGDFHCGMRAFTKSAYERMLTKTTGMEFATEMVANASHQGMRIAEIPTTLYPDKRDRAPHLRSFRDGWRHLRFILTYAPDHMFLLPGLLMLFVGIAVQLALVAGPVTVGGMYFGIHFVALGALLALVGFNVFNLGVFAKALLSRRYVGLRSRTVGWLKNRYSLELGLIVGAALITVGLAIDATILVRWLGTAGTGMESTIHLAFVATTAVVLGANVLFSAFLLNLVLDQETA
jgi:glycosyltransferase involved in cell wall biosynthesis